MTRWLFASMFVGAIALPASAQAPAGSCKVVFDAMLKETMTPHHAVTARADGTPIESIGTADATYVQLNGRWRKSPMTPKQTFDQQMENIRNTAVASCTPLPDEIVDGKAATVYQTHYEQKDLGASDAKVWIAKATGLPLRTDVSLQAGQKVSVVTRFDYDHITAPPVR
jgi:hypothetical protein